MTDPISTHGIWADLHRPEYSRKIPISPSSVFPMTARHVRARGRHLVPNGFAFGPRI